MEFVIKQRKLDAIISACRIAAQQYSNNVEMCNDLNGNKFIMLPIDGAQMLGGANNAS